MQKIQAAVLGLGHIGKRHASMIMQHPDMDLTATADILAAEMTGFDQQGVPVYNSLSELLSRTPSLDVVHICTPNGLHASQAINCLEAGKHVVIEKPMALTRADCEQIIHAAFRHHRHVFCVMQNRYSPPSQWLKKMVDEGKLGNILQVQINCFWNRDQRYYLPNGKPHPWHGDHGLDGGVLFTQFSHFIDTLFWVFGDIANISARQFNHTHQGITPFPDSGIAVFDLVRGGSGVLHFTTSVWDQNMESSIAVIGTRGSLKVGGQYMDRVEYCHVMDYEREALQATNPPNNYGPYQGSAANHAMVIDNIAGVIRNGNAVTTNALEGLKVVDMIQRIHEAALQA